MSGIIHIKKKLLSIPFFIKLSHWEYWNKHIIYAPIYCYWIYLGIRAKSLSFFNASNPLIENGGFEMESKADIYAQIPKSFYPKTILIPAGLNEVAIKETIDNNEFDFPLFVKPDIGGKGIAVKKINNLTDVVKYIQHADFPMIVQDAITYENEIGIFYYRYPWQANGNISGIVSKAFITVIGDGKSSILQLLYKTPRYILQIKALQKETTINFSEILEAGVIKVISTIGNHARGAKFIDDSHKITKQLTVSIDNICKQIPQFYFGRLDIMYSSWEDLEKGKNFYIIELNGAGSEPTHIYDPKHSLFFAWKEIAKHLKIMWRIALFNNKKNNVPYLTFKQTVTMFSNLKKVQQQLSQI
jgi:hypothetical protein